MQRFLIIATASALAFPALASEPPATPTHGSQCFRMSQIDGHKKGDDRTLYISARHRDVFRLDMSSNCLAGASSTDPLVMSPTAGNDVICRPLDLDLKIRMGPGGLTPCIIKDIIKLTPEQVAALPPKVKP
jgi:hypothetical protein